MGVYIKNITKDDLAENGALMWGKRIIFIPPEDIIPVQDHGDLIDRDSLKADLGITDWGCNKCQWGGLFGCKRDDFSDACFFLENAEAVIPAERSEDGET